MEAIRSKTVETFDQLKKKSSDQLRKISSRPPPADVAPAQAKAVATPSGRPAVVAAVAAVAKRDSLQPRSRSKWRKLALAAVAVAVVGVFFTHRQAKRNHEVLENELTQATPLLWSSSLADVKKISEHLDRSFEVSSYGKLANAVSGALGLAEAPVFSSLESEARALALRQHAILRLLDSKSDAGELQGLLKAADEAGVPKDRIAFAKLLPSLDAKSGSADAPQLPAEILQQDPVALLLSGILLERQGKVELAAERYAGAAKAREEWHLPKVYAARLALFTQGKKGAEPELERLRETARVDPNLAAMSRALNALSWVVDNDRPRELPDTAKLEASELASLPPALSQAPALVTLVQATLEEKDNVKQLLSQAIDEADGPALLVQLAGMAANVNQGDLVDDAIDKVQELAQGYAPAKALAVRMQLAKGDFAAARQTAKAAGLDASAIDAVEAYEAQDAKNLRGAIEAMPAADRKKPEYAAIVAAAGILTGTAYPSKSQLDDMLRTSSLWAELLAVDTALDQGDLKRAQTMIEGWAENQRTSLHQIRIARYERYKGRKREAVRLSKQALDQATTSSRALIEHLSALLADDRLQDAIKLYADPLYRDMLKPHEKWVDGLLLGKDKGWMAANIMVSYLQPPSNDEALSLKILSLRAMAVAGDPRAGVYLKRMGDLTPDNPDYLTAKAEY